MNTYAELLKLCGLSQAEAARMHNVRPDTVKSWGAGRNPVPAGVVAELQALYRRMDDRVSAILGEVEDMARRGVALEDRVVCTINDETARKEGWPCAGPANRSVFAAYALSENGFMIEPLSDEVWN